MANKVRRIDANALKDRIRQEPTDGMYTAEILEAIDEVPTVDSAPVVHGRWVYDGSGTHKCGVCGDYYTGEANDLFFCPRCGATMVEIEHPDKYGCKHDFVDGKWQRVTGIIREAYVERREVPQRGAKMDGGGEGD